jgi:hypothetical protein
MRRISDSKFVQHGMKLLESPAWRALSREGHLLLARIEIADMVAGGRRNGELIIAYEKFEAYGIRHRRAIARAIRDAEALGLLQVIRGRAGNGEFRAPNRFRLTYLSTETEKPTDEWATITTIDEAKSRLQAVKRRRQSSTWFHAKTAKIVPFSA